MSEIDIRERIAKKLAEIEYYMKRLQELSSSVGKNYGKADTTTKAATERNLQLISDLEIDVLALLDKHIGMGIAGDELSIMKKFEGKLSKNTMEKLKERRTLRNQIIHAYALGTSDKEIYLQASDLGDVKSFITEAKRLVAAK